MIPCFCVATGDVAKVDRLEKAIICLAEGKDRDDLKTKWEQVNLEKRLEELGLAPFFPEEVRLMLVAVRLAVCQHCCEGWLAADQCCA